MAELGFLARFFFIFYLFFASVSGQTLIENPTTTTFDVSSSIQKTRDVLAFTHESLDKVDQVKESSSGPKVGASTSTRDPAVAATGFTVQMQSRDTLDKSSYKDYKDFFHSRLQQDAAHIRALNKRLQGANKLANVAKLGESTAGGLDASIESGNNYESGAYFARISIGSPPKSHLMTIDTGSDVSWVQCQPCRTCYKQHDPIFDPSSSTTYSPISCPVPECQYFRPQRCTKATGLCRYSTEYGDGSTTVGNLAFETLTFGNTPVSNIAVGCGKNNKGRFGAEAGILSLGRGKLSILDQMKLTSFSLCLVDRDSKASASLELGKNIEQNDGTIFTPLIDNPKVSHGYYVGLTGLSVGVEQVPIPAGALDIENSGSGGVIVDSGSSLSYFPDDIYNSFRDIFRKQTSHLPSTTSPADVSQTLDTCYNITNVDSVQVPTINLHFSGSASLTLPAKNFLIPVNSYGTFCFGFSHSVQDLPISIIGSTQLQGTRVIYDIANSRIGFAPRNC